MFKFIPLLLLLSLPLNAVERPPHAPGTCLTRTSGGLSLTYQVVDFKGALWLVRPMPFGLEYLSKPLPTSFKPSAC